MDRKPFFQGPFNPKYKDQGKTSFPLVGLIFQGKIKPDLNLFNPEPVVHPIKKFDDLKFERSIEREKQVKLIKKCKKDNFKAIKFYN
jgi:hypothetical protein